MLRFFSVLFDVVVFLLCPKTYLGFQKSVFDSDLTGSER